MAVPVAFSASATARNGNGRLRGFSLRETSGSSSALVYVRNGNDDSAPIVAVISLVASESIRDWYGEEGVYCSAGIRLHVSSGTVEGAVYIS